MVQLLIADGDGKSRARIHAEAEKQGFEADETDSGISVIKMFRRKNYDLLILEVSLAELGGLVVCGQIRKLSDIPIIFISSKSREYDRLAGFEAGADDYVVKPLYPAELMARVRALLARSRGAKKRTLLSGAGITVNLNAREVSVEDRSPSFSPREYALLVYLMENPNIVLSREQILLAVWGDAFEGTDRTVDTHIKSLREKLGPAGKAIGTVWGVGYKMIF